MRLNILILSSFLLLATSTAFLVAPNPKPRTFYVPSKTLEPPWCSSRLYGKIEESRDKLQDAIQEHAKVVEEESIEATSEISIETTLDNVKNRAQDLKEKVKEQAEDAKDALQDEDDEGVIDKAKDAAISAKDKVKDAAVSAKDKVKDIAGSVKDKVKDWASEDDEKDS